MTTVNYLCTISFTASFCLHHHHHHLPFAFSVDSPSFSSLAPVQFYPTGYCKHYLWRRLLPTDIQSCLFKSSRSKKKIIMCRSVRLSKLRNAKHGTVISRKPVMVHRCQGEYFRQLLKPIT